MAARTGQGNTPGRIIRIPHDLWQAAKARAEAEGTTVSEVVRAALRTYVAQTTDRKGKS